MIAAVLVGMAGAWMYGRVAWGLGAEWVSSPDASYGLVLAAVAGALLWQRRHVFLAAVDRSASPLGPFVLLLAGLLLFVAGQLGADLFLTRLSLVVVTIAIVWMLAGARALRTIAAPLTFLAMAVPLPTLLLNTITLPLQFAASRVAESTLVAGGVPVYRDGNLLTLPSATLEVAEACSGLRSLVSLVAIAGLMAWLMRSGLLRRAAVIVLAVPIAIVMNGWRIAATGAACELFGRGAASGAPHEAMGWATFVVSTAVLGGLAHALEHVRRTPDTPTATVRSVCLQPDQTAAQELA
jgi:exosortase